MVFANALAGTTSLAGMATFAGRMGSAPATYLLQGQDPMSKYEGPSSRMHAALLAPHRPRFHKTSVFSNNTGAAKRIADPSVSAKPAADEGVMRDIDKEMSYQKVMGRWEAGYAFFFLNLFTSVPLILLWVAADCSARAEGLVPSQPSNLMWGALAVAFLIPIIPLLYIGVSDARRDYSYTNDQIFHEAVKRPPNNSSNLFYWCSMVKEAGRRVAGRDSKYEGATVDWFKEVIGTGQSVEYKGRNVNLVASMPPKMLAPFVKMAERSSSGALVLAEIARQNAFAEEFVKDIEISWKDNELDFEETTEAIEWLAMRGNESVAHWIAKKAKEENEEQERSLEIVEDLLNSDIPDSVYRVLESYGFTLRRGGPYRSQIRVAVSDPLSDEELAAEAEQQAEARALAVEKHI